MSDRFDARAYWAALSPEQQRWTGEAALLLGMSLQGRRAFFNGGIPPALNTRWQHAWDTVLEKVTHAGPSVTNFPAGPDLAAVDIRACRVCGCTEDSACDGGCHWVGPDLCSQCDPAAAANDDSFEFDCAICRRHITQSTPPSGDRCDDCREMPGWFNNAEMREYIEPDPDWVPPAAEPDNVG